MPGESAKQKLRLRPPAQEGNPTALRGLLRDISHLPIHTSNRPSDRPTLHRADRVSAFLLWLLLGGHGVAIAFLVIGSSPHRFRPLMIPSMLEKFGYVMTQADLICHDHHFVAHVQYAGAQVLIHIHLFHATIMI